MYLGPFGDYLNTLIERDGRTSRRLARDMANMFGDEERISPNTISRWLSGSTERPHRWQELIKLGIILKLSKDETNQLLKSSKHPTIDDLLVQKINRIENEWLTHWNDVPTSILIQPAPFQAPPNLQSFTGREPLIKQIQNYIFGSQTQIHVVSLCGMGGVGKTTLAIHLAYLLREKFSDGVLWARLDLSDPLMILQSFAESLGSDVSQYNDIESRSSRVRELLANKRALIVLDNVEDDEQIRPFLPPTGNTVLLLTSRRRDLFVADEGFSIILMPFDQAKKESLHLFRQILGGDITNEFRDDLNHIAKYLGHLPLAISIAANRIKSDPHANPTLFLDKIKNDSRRLSALMRGDRAVEFSLHISFTALPSHLQETFTVTTLFESEDFSIEAVSYICQISIEECETRLIQLYNLSLIQASRNGRYRLHPLLKDYGRDKKRLAGSIDRKVSYFLNFAIINQSNLNLLEIEKEDILTAFQIAYEKDSLYPLTQAVISFYSFFQTRGLFSSAIKHLNMAEKAAQKANDIVGLVAILSAKGHAASKLGQLSDGQLFYEHALKLARQLQDDLLVCELLLKKGALTHYLGDYRRAKIDYEEGLTIASQIKDEHKIAAFLTNIGLLESIQGNYEKAKSFYELALPLAQHNGTVNLQVTLLQNLGHLFEKQGNAKEAQDLFVEGLNLASKINDPDLKSRMFGNLGEIAISQGDIKQAHRYFHDGLHLAEKYDLGIEISRRFSNLASLAFLRGNNVRADFYYNKSLTQARKNGSLSELCKRLNQWGNFCLEGKSNPQEALNIFEEANDIASRTNIKPEIMISLFGISKCEYQMGDFQKAYHAALECESISYEVDQKFRKDFLSWMETLSAEAENNDEVYMTKPHQIE